MKKTWRPRWTDEKLEYASKMEFEKATEIRDKIKALEKIIWKMGSHKKWLPKKQFGPKVTS